ncbi:MAG: response regulator transcription factor [Planctomycetes bacterium]|nr:response regulator transcription factor [Planctomycetota bacterium]
MDHIRVVAADDHEMFRECLVERLNQEPDIQVIAHVGDAAEAALLVRDMCPEVVLLDIDMPGSPFVAAGEIARRCPATSIIFLSAYHADRHIARCIDAGARGFVLKSHDVQSVAAAIRDVAAGKWHFVPEVLCRMVVEDGAPTLKELPQTRFAQLTPREVEVLRLLAEGQSVKQAARSLGVSYKTVDNQTSSLMGKLDIHSRAELVRYAIREELAVV